MGRDRRTRRAGRTAAAPAPSRVPSERVLLACLLLTAAPLVVYAQVWTHEFVGLDDLGYIVNNPDVTAGLTARGVVWAFTTGQEGNWHPLTWLSHMLDVQLHGVRPGPHHLTGLAFHVANTLLLFGVLKQMTGKLGRSAVVAGLFALHPLHVESVAWASERKDVLSTLFWLLTMWAYVGYVRRPAVGRYGLTLALFALGLMAKPMLVTLPFVLLLLDVWPLGRSTGKTDGPSPGPSFIDRRAALRLVTEKVPFFALTLISSVVTFLAQQRAGAVAELHEHPLGARVANALLSYVGYLGKTFWPAGLAVMYPFPRSPSPWWVWGSLLMLAGVTGVVVRAASRSPYLAVGWLWYLGTLVPVIGLVQVGSQSMADRYTYVPLIGVFIMLAWGMPDLLARWRHRDVALPAVAGLALAACAVLAFVQVGYWKNSTALWTRAIAVTTDNFLVHYQLGTHLSKRGQSRDAVDHYREALRINPRYVAAHNNLGFALAGLGQHDDAIGHYTEAIRLLPTYPEARNNLALALAAQGKLDEAIREMREAVRIAPGRVESHFNLAALLRKAGQLPDAARHYSEGLRLQPGHADAHYRLGLVLVEQGSLDEAALSFERAVRLDPGFLRARRALDDLRRRPRPGPDAR
jgi:Flp pilus assembly protein TadD